MWGGMGGWGGLLMWGSSADTFTQEKKKKKSKSAAKGATDPATTKDGHVPSAPITAPASASDGSGGLRERRFLGPRVEEVEESD